MSLPSRPQYAIVLRTSPVGDVSPAIPVDERVTELQFGSQLPGGWAEATVGYSEDDRGQPTMYLPSPVDAPVLGSLRILVNGGVCYDGRISGRRRIGGYVRGVKASGWGSFGMKDDWYRGGGSEAIPARTIALDVLSTLAPDLSIPTGAQFLPPDMTYTPSEFVGRSPQEILEQMGRAGDAGTPWVFAVYDRVVSWFPETPVDPPTYRISWDDVSSDEDDTDVYGNAALHVNLTDGSTLLLIRSWPGGNSRSVHLDASDTSVAAGQAFLETWLATHQQPVATHTFTRTLDHWLERSDGGVTPPWLVRAGESIQIGDEPARYLSQTSFDAKSGELQIQVGPPARATLQRIMSDALALYGAIKTDSDLLTAAHRD